MKIETHQFFDCNNCQFKTISCKHLELHEFEAIREKSLQIIYKGHETIIKQGSRHNAWIFLHTGIVKVTIQIDTSKIPFTTFVSGPALLGSLNLSEKSFNFCSIICVTNCEVCLIDSETLRNTFQNNSLYFVEMINLILKYVYPAFLMSLNMVNLNVKSRIANVLLYLCESVFQASNSTFILPKKLIAEIAYCSYENVIINLSIFQKHKIIRINEKQIRIIDLEALKKHALKKN